MQVRQRYTEVFNVLIYVMCMEYRALVQTKRSHDNMAAEWEDLDRQLRVARATATMEHRVREQHAARAEEENARHEQAAAQLREELAAVKAENSVRHRCHRMMCAPAWLILSASWMSGDLQALSATLEAEVAAAQQKLRSREEAMSAAHSEMQRELEGVKDESDELQRKLRVAERQLAQFRKHQVCHQGAGEWPHAYSSVAPQLQWHV